jgi:hypothetical protein
LNTGNTSLNFIALTYPIDFPETASTDGDCAVSVPLTLGENCTLTIAFTPVNSPGNPSLLRNESVNFTTDLPNTPNQSVAVSGQVFLPSTAVPVFSVAGGVYYNNQTVTISDPTPAATIYYTVNGSTPTTASKKYVGPISITISSTLRAIATASGYTPSSGASATYNFLVATPVVTPSGGTYVDGQTVTITSDTANAIIVYSTTGSNPNDNSTRYTGPITISSTKWLKTYAVKAGYTHSPIVANLYNIQSPPAPPTFSPAAGTYSNAQFVTITDSVPGTTIYYTVNGTAPTTASKKYTGPIAVKSSSAIQAIAVATGYDPTSPVVASYTLAAATPVVSLAAGFYTGAQTVTITTDSTSAQLYYTTNGVIPKSNSARYTGPITISTSRTLKVIAIATGYTSSPVVTNTYTIQ